MAKALITGPAGLPVTLAQVKQHLRIETDVDDAYLVELAKSATAHVEAETGKSLLQQTWRIYLDRLPHDQIALLPVSPVISVGPVTVYGADSNPAIVTADNYQIDRRSEPARLLFKHALPVAQAMNGIEIDVVAGFGVAAVEVPGQLLRAILVLCAHWYAFRGSASDAALMGSTPRGFDALVAPFKQVRL